MSNATDSQIEADKMIRSTFAKISKSSVHDVERYLQICRWLLDFNNIEKGFKVKCYSRKIPDICFSVDLRGKEKWFFCIGHPQGLLFKPIKTSTSYLKRDEVKNLTYILYPESKKLDLEILKKYVFESYELLLNQLKLVSSISTTGNYAKRFQPQDNKYLPTKEDADAAERQLPNSGKPYGMEEVLDQIEINFKTADMPLKENWREITMQNIKIWFCNNAGGTDAA